MKKWFGAVALLVVVPLITAESCGTGTGGSAPGTSTSSKPVAVGTEMKNSDGLSVTVLSFKRGFTTSNQFDAPKAGNEYVQVVYKLVNGSKHEWSSPLFELSLIDANGQKYNEAFVTEGEDSVASLAAGGHADAVHDVYEVPKGLAIDVVWKPNLFESTVFQTTLT